MTAEPVSGALSRFLVLVVGLAAGGWCTASDAGGTDQPAAQTATARPDRASARPPQAVAALCRSPGPQEFAVNDGQRHAFRTKAAALRRCDSGRTWLAVEDGATAPEAASFYFSATGQLLDICQPLLWRSGCKRFENLLCEPYNFCTER